MKRAEDQIQAALFEYLGKAFPSSARWFMHPPNGGQRNVIVAAQLKRAGVRRGVPDLWFPQRRGGFCGLAMELKAPKGRVTPEQVEWLEMLAEEGWLTSVCVGLDAAIATVDAYMRLPRDSA